MSRKNSLEAKRARREASMLKGRAPVDREQIWVETEDKYGRKKLKPVMMPVIRRDQ